MAANVHLREVIVRVARLGARHKIELVREGIAHVAVLAGADLQGK
jgi:hypothetical protein